MSYSNNLELETNHSMSNFEGLITSILSGHSNKSQLQKAISYLENSGCNIDTEVMGDRNRKRGYQKKIDVIFFDLCWVSPGITGGFLGEGNQVCYTRKKKVKKTIGTKIFLKNISAIQIVFLATKIYSRARNI